MSKPKRASFVDLLDPEVTSSRDDVVTSREDNPIAEPPAPLPQPRLARATKPKISAAPAAAVTVPGRRSPNDNTRHSYHTSLYLPEEAQFALREIALTMRRAKPHDVMLEAMAELFAKYNKGDLAAECRRRITSRDKAVT